jgi:hypothetical protein
MAEPFEELARRDAKAIRGSVALGVAALAVAIVGLFTPAIVGGIAAIAGLMVLLNAVAAWLAGPRLMAERRVVLAPAVFAGLPMGLGTYAAFGSGEAVAASLPAAALAALVLGLTLAGGRR